MTTVRTLPSQEEFSKASRRWAAEQLFCCRQQNRRSRGNNKENNRIRLRNRQSHLRTCRAYQNRQRKRFTRACKNDEVIFDTVGIKPSVVRPPCGCYNDFIRQNEKRPLVMWTIDTRDWSHQNKDRTVNTVLSSVKDGDIVLMHDLFVPTAEASEILIPELVNRGFQLVTVSELINYRGEINGAVLNNS